MKKLISVVLTLTLTLGLLSVFGVSVSGDSVLDLGSGIASSEDGTVWIEDERGTIESSYDVEVKTYSSDILNSWFVNKPDGSLFVNAASVRILNDQKIPASVAEHIRVNFMLGTADNGYNLAVFLVEDDGSLTRQPAILENGNRTLSVLTKNTDAKFIVLAGIELPEVTNLKDTMQAGVNFEGLWCVNYRSNYWMLEDTYYRQIRENGFNNIRIPVKFSISEGPDYTLSNDELRALDKVLTLALDNDLIVVIDFHDGESHHIIEKFYAIWRQLAERYRYMPEQVMFELVNEPGMDTFSLNRLQLNTISIIRRTNPTRTVAFASAGANEIPNINYIKYPQNDPNIMVSVHNYREFGFTHQGATWVGEIPPGHVPFLEEYKETITTGLTDCADYEAKTGRTVWVSEFGVYLPQADEPEVEKYVKFITGELARLDLGYSYWEFCNGFGIYSLGSGFKDFIVDNMAVNWNGCSHVRETVTTPSTCKAQGKVEEKCKYCGEVFSTTALPLADHTGEWNVITEATCTTAGTRTRECTTCGKTETESYYAHEWSEATCTKPMTCAKCKKTSGKALGHDYFDTVVPPTFVSDGYTNHVCKRCGDTCRDEITPKFVTRTEFSDVTPKKWFNNAVYQVYDAGLMAGMAANKFEPNLSMTRAQFVTVMFRMSGEVGDFAKAKVYSDVPADKWYSSAVCWAADRNLVGGYPDGTFKPDKAVTRAEMAKLFIEFFKYMNREIVNATPLVDSFADKMPDWAKDYVEEFRKLGFVGGIDGKFKANDTSTRAQIATILVRYLEADIESAYRVK